MKKQLCGIRTAIIFIGMMTMFGLGIAQDAKTFFTEKEAYQLLADLQETDSSNDISRISLCDSLSAYFMANGDECSDLLLLAKKANIWDQQYMIDDAFKAIMEGVGRFNSTCDTIILLELYTSFSNVLISMEDFSRADSICNSSMEWCNGREEATQLKFGFMNNLALCKFYTDQFEQGYSLTRSLYDQALISGDTNMAMLAAGNLGALKARMGDLDSGAYFFTQQLRWTEKRSDHEASSQLYNNLAGIASDQGDNYKAILLIDSGLKIAQEHSILSSQIHLKENLASQYAFIGEFDSAYVKIKEFNELKDSLLSTERIRAVTDMQEKYESEKKARQIQEMKATRLDDELDKEKLTRTRNVSYSVGFGILLIAGGLWSRLRHMRRSKALIEIEKGRSDDLLLNILPSKVADELKETGKSLARKFENVTVLFSDFKEFTSFSERLSPEALVAEIDVCFQAFDIIMEKYNIEKIKTIGDAYMAAGGLQTPTIPEPMNVILAAIEMQDFLMARKTQRDLDGLPAFEMRVGIHTGPVVAGIVGLKKFQYDIWGDTVNIASRMESSGAVNKVNISGSTYALLKNEQDLEFESRGKIAAKGKGEMEMWFTTLKNKGSSLV